MQSKATIGQSGISHTAGHLMREAIACNQRPAGTLLNIGAFWNPAQHTRNSVSSSCGKWKLKHSAPCRTAPDDRSALTAASKMPFVVGSPKPYRGVSIFWAGACAPNEDFEMNEDEAWV